MEQCCRRFTGALFEEYLGATNGQESVLTLRFDELSKLHPALWTFYRSIADIYAANIPATESAIAISCECPDCHSPACLVIVSSPLLLLIWRTMSILMRTVKRWDETENGLQVEFFDSPTDSDLFELQTMVSEYVRGCEIAPLAYDTEKAKIAHVPKPCRSTFFRMIDLAQTFIVGHEVAHALSNDILSRALPELLAIREGSKRFVADHCVGLNPKAAASWVEEITADLVSVLMLIRAQLNKFGSPGHESNQLFHAAASVAGGVGLAMEAMLHITCGSSPDLVTAPEDQSHPPLNVRWQVIRSYLYHISQTDAKYPLDHIAEIIARLSKMFILR